MPFNDQTEFQSNEDRDRSRDLSMRSSQPPGKTVGYSIEQFLGSGAYGEVWSGTDKKTGRRVAIKFYTRRTSNDMELLAREVEKLAALSADRYVVQLLDVDWKAEPPYFVMDYLEHGSLEDLLQKDQLLPVAMAEDLFTEIATGLMHLHGKGIFHCDLKPGNVLLDQDGKPRLADFGQARLRTERAPSLGTLFFMAPEQADLDAVPAARWDVYALGALLYCMLVGKPPYHSQALTEKIESSTSIEERLVEYQRSLRNAPQPTEHHQVPGVDRALADIIDQAIDPNPKQRFESVQSVMFALRQRELAKARRPLLVLGLLGPLLLLTVMSLFSWFAYRQANADTEAAIYQEAIESNQFAAKLAARSAGEKIDQYFRAVEQLARDTDFVQALEQATGDTVLSEIARDLDDPNNNEDEAFEEIRNDYRGHKARLEVQRLLERQMKDPYFGHLDCASWFTNDLRGNQVASIFEVTPDTNTIARNYSYRTYFTGLDRDLKKTLDGEVVIDVTPFGVERPMIDRPHLSAVFLSKGTFTWKVAFSAPVRNEDGHLIGIVACTSEMGNFVDFDNATNQYATLIDARDGEYQGAILEHPLFAQLATNPEQIPRVSDIAKIEMTGDFEDPLARLPGGELYLRKLIAALQPVRSTRFSASEIESGQGAESGLYVLVAEDYGAVISPVQRLSGSLFWLAIYATVFFLFIALAMWLLVVRMLKDSNNRMTRAFAGGTDSSLLSNSQGSGV